MDYYAQGRAALTRQTSNASLSSSSEGTATPASAAKPPEAKHRVELDRIQDLWAQTRQELRQKANALEEWQRRLAEEEKLRQEELAKLEARHARAIELERKRANEEAEMLREDVRAAVSRADAADANAGKAKDALGRAERRLEEAANALQRQGAIIAQQQAARKEQDEVVDALRREVVQAKDDAKRISDAYAADIARRDQAMQAAEARMKSQAEELTRLDEELHTQVETANRMANEAAEADRRTRETRALLAAESQKLKAAVDAQTKAEEKADSLGRAGKDNARLLTLLHRAGGLDALLDDFKDSGGASYVGHAEPNLPGRRAAAPPTKTRDPASRARLTEELEQLTARYQNLGGGSAGETTLRPPSGGPGGARSERVHAESMKWVPKAVYELAARFRRDHAPRCTKDALARLLASLNRVWHERERARANRMRTEFHRRMVEWRRQLTAACTTDGVALNLELQRCKAEIRQLRALGIAQGKNLRGSLDAVEDTKTATSSAPRLGVVPLREGADSERLLASALTAVDRLSREVIRASRDNESLREVVGTTDRGGFEAGARWTSERCVTLVDNLATDVETLGASFANRMAAMPPDGEDFLVRMCRAETQLLRDVRTLISRCRDQVSESNEEASTAGGFAAQKVHEEDGVGGGAFDEATAEAVEAARKRFGGEAAREYGDLVDDDVDDALRMLM
ncbi:hypothetical protein RI054_06g35100 [Pseudoscourfieldia marina]